MAITGCNYGVHDFVHDPDNAWQAFANRIEGMPMHVHVCAKCGATYIDPGKGPCFKCRGKNDG